MKLLPINQNQTISDKIVLMVGVIHQTKDLSALDEVFAERNKNFLYPCCYGGTPVQVSTQV